MRSELSDSLQQNAEDMQTLLNVPENSDIIRRDFAVSGVSACLFYLEGMAGTAFINQNILYPCRAFGNAMDVEPQARAQYLVDRVLDVAETKLENRLSELTQKLLEGLTVLLVDGCSEAILLETRLYERRMVSTTKSESVVVGGQQGFVENLRTNVTLVRRIVRSPMLISEVFSIGKQLPTNVSIMYLKGAVNEKSLSEVRRRVRSLDVDAVPDSGHLRQLIEERPFMLLPQTLQTERPDRTAFLISEGRIAIMVDNSPYALIAPITLFDLMRPADDHIMRWQHAMMNRVIRLAGMMISLILPGLYIALTLHHTQMIPIELLTSIAEARADVPFPVMVEILIMEFSFYLMNEAGTRMPSQIGPALGIVGAMVLGQAAVTANLISPLLIIITALSGLGNYTISDYSLSLTVQILRLGLLIAGAMLGLYGLTALLFVYVCSACATRSFGQPYMAPVAPWRPKNTHEAVMRQPMWKWKLPYLVDENSWLKRTPDGDTMRTWEEKKQ